MLIESTRGHSHETVPCEPTPDEERRADWLRWLLRVPERELRAAIGGAWQAGVMRSDIEAALAERMRRVVGEVICDD